MPETYTIEVQRWPWPFYQKHEVLSHELVTLGRSVRLRVVYPSGHILEIPNLDRKRLKIYPEYLRLTAKQLDPGDPPLLE